jgi:hypothetical protein
MPVAGQRLEIAEVFEGDPAHKRNISHTLENANSVYRHAAVSQAMANASLSRPPRNPAGSDLFDVARIQ